jgi:FlaG/FlaF family flagellin (archaellin)
MARYGKPVIAVVVMGAIIAILLMLFTPRSTSRSSALERASPAQLPAPKP